MKIFIKNIYILTLLLAVGFTSFASAATSKAFSKTDCYRKNNSYQCTIKTCKVSNPKSCTYKIIKATPPVYGKIVVNSSSNLLDMIASSNSASTSTGVISSGSVISSGIVVTGSNSLTGSTGSIIVPISNTKNTISGLPKFYDTISGSIVINNSGARYSLVEFGDFECMYCQKFHNKKILETVMSKYPSNINYYFMNYPLVKIHANAQYLAKGYICTNAQDKKLSITYMNFIYDQTIGDVVLLLNEWKKGLDQTTFDMCMNATGSDASIEFQKSIGDKIGITGTPSVLMINNDTAEYELIAGAYDTGAYNSVIENRQNQLNKFPYTAGK